MSLPPWPYGVALVEVILDFSLDVELLFSENSQLATEEFSSIPTIRNSKQFVDWLYLRENLFLVDVDSRYCAEFQRVWISIRLP